MTANSIIEQYTERKQTAREGLSDTDAIDDLGCFGWFRGTRDKAEMLELRKKTGSIAAIPYGWIEFIQFDPSEGIVLEAHGRKIRIRGRNLNIAMRPTVRLLEGIIRRRVPWVQEMDESAQFMNDRTTVVEEIVW